MQKLFIKTGIKKKLNTSKAGRKNVRWAAALFLEKREAKVCDMYIF